MTFRFPISEACPVEHHGTLPEAADVVVIGGGVIGVCTALYAARAGLRVVLVEKGRIGGEQSSRNWGWIRQQGRDPAELPIMVEANALWQELARDTNEDFGLRIGGVTYLANREKELEDFEGWLPYAKAHGLDTRLLTSAEVAQMLPGARERWHGALYTASDMRAEPWKAVPALARIAVRDGVTVLEDCAARTLLIEGGAVKGLVTEKGTIRADQVVVAGGAWSSLFLRRHGVKLPQLSVRATVAAVDAAPMPYIGGATDEHIAWRTREDGGYSLAAGGFHELFIGPDAFRALPKFLKQLRADPFGTRFLPAAPKGYPDSWRTPRTWAADEISPFERCRVLNPAPNARKVRDLVARFGRLFPQLGPVRLKGSWAGLIDTMPDVVPVVDRIETHPGLIVACGMSGHGFGIGPGMGRVIARMLAGQAPGHDMTRFRAGRFADGSPIEIGPSV